MNVEGGDEKGIDRGRWEEKGDGGGGGEVKGREEGRVWRRECRRSSCEGREGQKEGKR